MNTSNASHHPIRQACAVPFRRSGEHLELCLITSLKKKRWIYPKGIVDPGETLHQTALKEAFEEAGLHGRIVGPPLGQFEDAKWGTKLLVTAFLMEVTACDDHWHEAHARQRRWVALEEASTLVSKLELRQITEAARRQIHVNP